MTTDSPKASNSASIQRMESVSNWLVLWNMPGYMPEMEPYVLDSWESARDSLIDELEREMDSIDETLSGEHALVLAIESLRALAPFAEWSGYVGSYYYLLEATDEPTDDEREAQESEPEPDSAMERARCCAACGELLRAPDVALASELCGTCRDARWGA